MQAPRPRIPSFLDSPANTSTPTCVSLSSLVQQLNNHQALNEVSFLIILSMCEGVRDRALGLFYECWAKPTRMGGVVLLPLKMEVQLVIFSPLD